jgi:hypothetical protein
MATRPEHVGNAEQGYIAKVMTAAHADPRFQDLMREARVRLATEPGIPDDPAEIEMMRRAFTVD